MPIEIIFPSVVAVFTFVTLGFLVSVIIKRNDIADVMWGPGIALAAHVAIWSSTTPPSTVQLVLLALITVWALRLATRIGRKNLRKPGEDPRYKRWRDTWRYFYLRSYLQVFLLQGGLMLVLAYPAVHASLFSEIVSPVLIVIGVVIWLIGYFFEAIGDAQLDGFLKEPKNKGKLMRYGLWRYTRHPNYFGEITMWWAIGLMTVTLPYGYLVLASPITITLLIHFVSGVPLLEAAFKDHPEWAEYERATSMLVPWWPKK